MVVDRIKNQIGHFHKHKKFNLRALDVGCGTGYLLDKLLKLGLDAWGVDPYPRIEEENHHLSSRITMGTIEKVDRANYHFITAIEVLEHVEDYIGLLASMKRLLHPDGLIISTVPNNWEIKIAQNNSQPKDPLYGHLWQFDMKSFASDLRSFSNNVSVESIYSSTLDRRLLSITRIFPSKAVILLSRILVKYLNNGGWLLGIIRKNGAGFNPGDKANLVRPSAVYYKDTPLFKGKG
jgi:SAM-dependent methyltransferase